MVPWSRPQSILACVLIWTGWIYAVQDIIYNNYNRRLIGGVDGHRSGYSVAKAGDVNGDGIGDVIVGSYLADPLTRTDAGVTYVVLGSRTYSPMSDVELGQFFNGTTTGFRILGANAGDNSGFSVSGAGDFNNDNYDDIIIGAFAADPNGKSNAGAAYIIFGSAAPLSVDLRSMVSGATTGIRVLGAAIEDNCGWSVAAGGDINGDNTADVLIGAPLADPGGRSAAGTVYVLWGHNANTVFADIDLALLVSGVSVGYRINGWSPNDQTGYSVSSAGDFNKDNYGDMILSAHLGSSQRGGAFVVYGHANSGGWTDFEMSSTGSGNNKGLYMMGAAVNEKAGSAVSGAGDINNDGYDDVLIGAPLGDPIERSASNTDAGITYVVFGRAALGNIPLPAATGGFRIVGATAGDNSGTSVGTVGDFNADGYDDIIIGAPGYSSSAGVSYVVYGHSNTVAFPDLDLLALADGTRVACTAASSFSGYAVAGAGDVNGDGGGDIIIGAYGTAIPTRNNPGASFIYHGVASPTSQPSRQPSSQPSRQPSRQPSSQPSAQPASDPTGQPSRQPSAQPSAQPAGAPTSQPSRQPSSVPTTQPSRQPSARPSAQPSSTPTRQPSSQPSTQPSGQPVGVPTAQPSRQPSSRPTSQPSSQPSRQPTAQPSSAPTRQPSSQPSMQPSQQPAAAPTAVPSAQPSGRPSAQPSRQPSRQPTSQPSSRPSRQPSSQPSMQPSRQPTAVPTTQPSRQPSSRPTSQPSSQPSRQPTTQPSARPSSQPSSQPSMQPSRQPSSRPTAQPSVQPSAQPTTQPSGRPSMQPTEQPSTRPSSQPSSQPSLQPTSQPTQQPTAQPSEQPSSQPTTQPTLIPTTQPTNTPTTQPTTQPTSLPSTQPTSQPTLQPSTQPTLQPSTQPTNTPSVQPSTVPSTQPTAQPTAQPSGEPSSQPSAAPTSQPSMQPSSLPSVQPSAVPTTQPTYTPTTQPTSQPSTLPTTQPSSQPTTQPSLQPFATPTSQPSQQPLALPTSQPSSQPTLQPSTQPTTTPTSQPTSQPSTIPSTQPSAQPTHSPTLYIGEWAATLHTDTTLSTALVVQSAVWGCGSDNTTYTTHNSQATRTTQSVCTVADARTGELITIYKFPWDSVVWAGDSVVSDRVLLTGRISGGSIGGGIGSGSVTSEIANCAALYGQMSCTIQSYNNVDIRDASLNEITSKVVNVGRTGSAATVILYNTANGSTSSYTYKPKTSSTGGTVVSMSLLKVESLSSFYGSFVCGTSVNNVYKNSILSGWVDTNTGSAKFMHIFPTTGTIRNSTDLVTALAVEPTSSDLFVGGGIDVSVGSGSSGSSSGVYGYVVRKSVLYQRIVYGVKYVAGTSTRRILSTSTASAVTMSVVRGMVVMEDRLYTIIDTTSTNTTHLSILKSNTNTGSIVKQVHITAPNASSILCTDITTAGSFMSIACTIHTMYSTVQSLLLTIDQDLSLRRLPAGFTKHYNPTYTTQPLSFTLTPFTTTTTPHTLTNTTYSYGLNSVPPTLAPTCTPTTLSTLKPTPLPTVLPTLVPSTQPTSTPSATPTISLQPTSQPSTSGPTNTYKPTLPPTTPPTRKPSAHPTLVQSVPPTLQLTSPPTLFPTLLPTLHPTTQPSVSTTVSTTTTGTTTPTLVPTHSPTALPSTQPTSVPTALPTITTAVETGSRSSSNNTTQTVMLGASLAGAVVVLALLAYVVYRKRRNNVHVGDLLSPKPAVEGSSVSNSGNNNVVTPAPPLPIQIIPPVSNANCNTDVPIVRTMSTNSVSSVVSTHSRKSSTNTSTGSVSTNSGTSGSESCKSGVGGVGGDCGGGGVSGGGGGGGGGGSSGGGSGGEYKTSNEYDVRPGMWTTSNTTSNTNNSTPQRNSPANVPLKDTLPLTQVASIPLVVLPLTTSTLNAISTQNLTVLPNTQVVPIPIQTRTNSTYSSDDSSSYSSSDESTDAAHTEPQLHSNVQPNSTTNTKTTTNTTTTATTFTPQVRRARSKRAVKETKYDPVTGRKINTAKATRTKSPRSPRAALTTTTSIAKPVKKAKSRQGSPDRAKRNTVGTDAKSNSNPVATTAATATTVRSASPVVQTIPTTTTTTTKHTIPHHKRAPSAPLPVSAYTQPIRTNALRAAPNKAESKPKESRAERMVNISQRWGLADPPIHSVHNNTPAITSCTNSTYTATADRTNTNHMNAPKEPITTSFPHKTQHTDTNGPHSPRRSLHVRYNSTGSVHSSTSSLFRDIMSELNRSGSEHLDLEANVKE